MDTGKMCSFLHALRPAILMVIVQLVFGGVNIFYKLAMNDGMSMEILVAYRFLFAAILILPLALIIERKNRPKLTWMVLVQSCLCGLFGGPMAQNMYIQCIAFTSPTFAAAISNLIPAITYILAIALRLEELSIKTWVGKAKLMGTLLGLAGAMTLTLYKGPIVNFISTNINLIQHNGNRSAASHQVSPNHGLGSVYGIGSCFAYAIWMILQTKLNKRYPCPYSTTAMTCIFATILGSVFAMCVERDWSAWKLGWDIRLATVAYTGVMASGLMFTVLSWCIMMRGPVFVSVFNPLMLVFVAILEALLLRVKLHLGSIVGGAVIVIGLYGMIWGKGQEMKMAAKLAPSTSSGHSETLDIVVTSPNATSNQVTGTANTTSATHEDPRNGVTI